MTYQWHPSNPGMLYELEGHAHSDRPRLGSRRAQGSQAGKPERFARRTKFASLAGVCKHYQARAPSAAEPRPWEPGGGPTAFQNFGLENLAWQADFMVRDDVLIGLPCIWPTARANAFPVAAQGLASSCYGKAGIAREVVRLRAGIG